MASDQHMIKTLSDMLQDGETLLHPIFGYIQYTGFQQFAYFGLTETHFLIAYLSGETVTDTTRIPLNIKSVQIKKSKLLSKYSIHILLEKGKAYTICAFPKTMNVKSQKENLPLFLKLLQGKAQENGKPLEEMEGEKIRQQYFNAYIYILLAFLPTVPVVVLAQEFQKGNFDFWNAIGEMAGAVPVVAVMYGILIGPFVILSILNRFRFGKVLGVTNDGILFLENKEISIKNIIKIIYHPQVMSRRKISFSYATFVVQTDNKGTKSFDVTHFPMYGLRKIKKYNPDIKLSCDPYIWFLLLCPTVISAILGFLPN